MGLFRRTVKTERIASIPSVYITHEQSSALYTSTITSRFFFADQLIEAGRREEAVEAERTITTLLPNRALPNRESYVELLRRLREVVHQDADEMTAKFDLTRCYPHYIAVQWNPDYQPERDHSSARSRIEAEVVAVLAEYFGWQQPVVIGRFHDNSDRYRIATRLGVDWTAGG